MQFDSFFLFQKTTRRAEKMARNSIQPCVNIFKTALGRKRKYILPYNADSQGVAELSGLKISTEGYLKKSASG